MGPWRPGELLALMRQWQPTPGDEEPVTLANGTSAPLYGFLREWVGKELHIRDWAVNITAKQVRLYGTAYVDGDITHEQLAMETGAFFQGRSLKFQRPAAPAQPAAIAAPSATPPAPKPL